MPIMGLQDEIRRATATVTINDNDTPASSELRGGRLRGGDNCAPTQSAPIYFLVKSPAFTTVIFEGSRYLRSAAETSETLRAMTLSSNCLLKA